MLVPGEIDEAQEMLKELMDSIPSYIRKEDRIKYIASIPGLAPGNPEYLKEKYLYIFTVDLVRNLQQLSYHKLWKYVEKLRCVEKGIPYPKDFREMIGKPYHRFPNEREVMISPYIASIEEVIKLLKGWNANVIISDEASKAIPELEMWINIKIPGQNYYQQVLLEGLPPIIEGVHKSTYSMEKRQETMNLVSKIRKSYE